MTSTRVDAPPTEVLTEAPTAPPVPAGTVPAPPQPFADESKTAIPDRVGPMQLSLGVVGVDGLRVAVPLENLAEVCAVPHLDPVFSPRPGELGTLSLRGSLIPIFDLGAVARSEPAGAEPPSYAAILRRHDRLLGIAIEEADGLIHVPGSMLQDFFDEATLQRAVGDTPPVSPSAHGSVSVDRPLSLPSHTPSDLFSGCLLHEDRVIWVLCPASLFQGRGTASGRHGANLTSEAYKESDKGKGPSVEQGAAVPMLTFQAGGATLALPAIAIHGTVPKCDIEENALTSGACLGSIAHHGHSVPVLRISEIVGLGVPTQHTRAEIVVLRFADDQRVGFAVDTILQMMRVEPSAVAPAPPAANGARPLVQGTVVQPGETEQIFILDDSLLRSEPIVSELAKLSRKGKASRSKSFEDQGKSSSGLTTERVRYLVFDVGIQVAAPVVQVLRIITPPDHVVPRPDGRGAGLKGFFALDGRSVPLLDLGKVLGLCDRGTSPNRVLLVEASTQTIGFAVHSVRGIETSAWRRAAQGEMPYADAAVVQLGQGNDRKVVPAVDLNRIATHILAR